MIDSKIKINTVFYRREKFGYVLRIPRVLTIIPGFGRDVKSVRLLSDLPHYLHLIPRSHPFLPTRGAERLFPPRKHGQTVISNKKHVIFAG
jgi:hypothetical protein